MGMVAVTVLVKRLTTETEQLPVGVVVGAPLDDGVAQAMFGLPELAT